jgi:hypothetical protein
MCQVAAVSHQSNCCIPVEEFQVVLGWIGRMELGHSSYYEPGSCLLVQKIYVDELKGLITLAKVINL